MEVFDIVEWWLFAVFLPIHIGAALFVVVHFCVLLEATWKSVPGGVLPFLLCVGPIAEQAWCCSSCPEWLVHCGHSVVSVVHSDILFWLQFWRVVLCWLTFLFYRDRYTNFIDLWPLMLLWCTEWCYSLLMQYCWCSGDCIEYTMENIVILIHIHHLIYSVVVLHPRSTPWRYTIGVPVPITLSDCSGGVEWSVVWLPKTGEVPCDVFVWRITVGTWRYIGNLLLQFCPLQATLLLLMMHSVGSTQSPLHFYFDYIDGDGITGVHCWFVLMFPCLYLFWWPLLLLMEVIFRWWWPLFYDVDGISFCLHLCVILPLFWVCVLSDLLLFSTLSCVNTWWWSIVHWRPTDDRALFYIRQRCSLCDALICCCGGTVGHLFPVHCGRRSLWPMLENSYSGGGVLRYRLLFSLLLMEELFPLQWWLLLQCILEVTCYCDGACLTRRDLPFCCWRYHHCSLFWPTFISVPLCRCSVVMKSIVMVFILPVLFWWYCYC